MLKKLLNDYIAKRLFFLLLKKPCISRAFLINYFFIVLFAGLQGLLYTVLDIHQVRTAGSIGGCGQCCSYFGC